MLCTRIFPLRGTGSTHDLACMTLSMWRDLVMFKRRSSSYGFANPPAAAAVAAGSTCAAPPLGGWHCLSLKRSSVTFARAHNFVGELPSSLRLNFFVSRQRPASPSAGSREAYVVPFALQFPGEVQRCVPPRVATHGAGGPR